MKHDCRHCRFRPGCNPNLRVIPPGSCIGFEPNGTFVRLALWTLTAAVLVCFLAILIAAARGCRDKDWSTGQDPPLPSSSSSLPWPVGLQCQHRRA